MWRIVFLAFGVLFSWFTYDLVLRTSENPYLAALALVVVLAFWIGTLRVIIKGEF